MMNVTERWIMLISDEKYETYIRRCVQEGDGLGGWDFQQGQVEYLLHEIDRLRRMVAKYQASEREHGRRLTRIETELDKLVEVTNDHPPTP
jgi:hypothetical protein